MITIRFAPPGTDRQIEVEGDNTKQVFERLVRCQQVFGVKECGNCGSPVYPNIRPVKTDKTEFDAYEWRCAASDCGSSLGLGVNRDGQGIFLRWDEKWYKPDSKRDETPPI
jgi:hypothetical protein